MIDFDAETIQNMRDMPCRDITTPLGNGHVTVKDAVIVSKEIIVALLDALESARATKQ